MGDFNGDGKADLAMADYYNTVAILLGRGNGTFQTSTAYPGNGINFTSVTAGDFNGDGKTDLAASEGSGTVIILLGNGNGTFRAPTDYTVGDWPTSVTVGDFNGDGKANLVVANGGSYPNYGNTVSVLLGNGDGTFQAKSDYAAGVEPDSVALGDFNGDGKTDLAVGTLDTTFLVSILLGTPVQNQASVGLTSSTGSSTYGQTMTLTATVTPCPRPMEHRLARRPFTMTPRHFPRQSPWSMASPVSPPPP